MANAPENLTIGAEDTVEARQAAVERLEQLEKKAESNPEHNTERQERQAEKAKVEALEKAVSAEVKNNSEKEGSSRSSKRSSNLSRKAKEASFKTHMKRVQTELPPASRAFSKVIHNKTVERISDVVGSTVARPNAILSGAIFAFILVLAVYITAKTLGYPLSGFETIGAFIVGWIVGIVYDYIKALVTGHNN
jgi:cobalamin biosynthesis Mg chelatase CobN